MGLLPDIGGILGGIGNLVGGIGGVAESVANRRSQERENDITREREDNSIQRRVADLKAAGLSPILAAGQGAAAAPLMAPKYSGTSESISKIAGAPADAMRFALEQLQQKANIARTNADTKVANLAADRAKIENDIASKTSEAQIETAKKRVDLLGADIALRKQEKLFAVEHTESEWLENMRKWYAKRLGWPDVDNERARALINDIILQGMYSRKKLNQEFGLPEDEPLNENQKTGIILGNALSGKHAKHEAKEKDYSFNGAPSVHDLQRKVPSGADRF